MKCILSDFRRAVTGRWFLAAVFASALMLWLSIGSDTWYFFDTLANGDVPDWPYFLQSACTGKVGLLLLPALSALPYGAEALREIRTGAFRPVLFRVGRRAYIAGKVLSCFVSGALVQLCAMAALMVFLTVAVWATGNASLPLMADSEVYSLLLGRMLCGGGWALIGCAIALLSATASAAMIAPLCLCYTLTMIATRFFPQTVMLDPANWQSAPTVSLLLAMATLMTVTSITLHREVQRHV